MSWNDDMSAAPKDGTDIWLYFPLEGLDSGWHNVVACHWNSESKLWTFKSRAYRSYSREYQPTHWQLLTDKQPKAPK
jgi:hypothetical protein